MEVDWSCVLLAITSLDPANPRFKLAVSTGTGVIVLRGPNPYVGPMDKAKSDRVALGAEYLGYMYQAQPLEIYVWPQSMNIGGACTHVTPEYM